MATSQQIEQEIGQRLARLRLARNVTQTDLAEKAGIDGRAGVDVIGGGAAGSWQMVNRYGTMIDDKFEHGFAVDWMRKDLAICLATAEEIGAALPVTALVDQFYKDVQAMGGGRWDTSSLIRLLTDTAPLSTAALEVRRTILMEAGAEAAQWQRQYVVDQEAPLVESFKAHGVTVTEPDTAPFIAASQPLYEQALTTDGQKALFTALTAN